METENAAVQQAVPAAAGAVLEKEISFSFPLDLVKQTEENGEFHVVGYAATTDFDLQGDIITEEALKDSAADLLKNSTVLLNHDLKQPIGRVTKVQFDKRGLLIDALISKTEAEIIQKIKEGILNKFSIRGQVLERERKFMPELDRVVNVIKRMSLVEVSLVSVPANPEARAIGWYMSKALEESDQKSEGGNPMPGEEVVVEEISNKEEGASAAPPAKPEATAVNKKNEPQPNGSAPVVASAEPAKPEPSKPPAVVAPAAAQPDNKGSLLPQSVTEIQKNLHAILKEELAQMVSGEVQKQVEAALKNLPTLRKGLIQQEADPQDVKKQFESLSPDKKLRTVLAMNHG
ncbi:MAG: HK97 family phage prohead protease [Elusimicrobia bacterium]|nr:HK97 family phage prohead protease [Elusimicrobiota bacterium]